MPRAGHNVATAGQPCLGHGRDEQHGHDCGEIHSGRQTGQLRAGNWQLPGGNGTGNDGFIYWDRPNGRGAYGASWIAGSVLRPLSKDPTDGNGQASNVMPTLGSWHPGVVNFLFVDGSVHSLSVTTSVATLTSLGNVNDGAVINLP